MRATLWSAYEGLRTELLSGHSARARHGLREAAERAVGTDLAPPIAAASETFECADADRAPTAAYEALVRAPTSLDLLHDYLSMELPRLWRDLSPHAPFAPWDWSRLAEAALAAYERSGQPRFAELVLGSFEAALDLRDHARGHRDAVRGRPLMSWGRGDHLDRGWTCVVTAAGRMTYPVFRLARVIGRADVDPTQLARLDAAVAEARKALEEFHEDFRTARKGRVGYFWRPTREDVEPLNHALSAGRALLELASHASDADAHRKAEQLAGFFRWAMFEDEGGAYVWTYQPTPERRKPRQPNLVWKADVDLSFALLAREHGVQFTDADVERLCRTFRCNICLSNGRVNSYIGQQKIVPMEDKVDRAKRRVYGLLPWNALGAWEPGIAHRLDAELARNRALFPGGWFGAARGVYAYALRLHVPPERDARGPASS